MLKHVFINTAVKFDTLMIIFKATSDNLFIEIMEAEKACSEL